MRFFTKHKAKFNCTPKVIHNIWGVFYGNQSESALTKLQYPIITSLNSVITVLILGVSYFSIISEYNQNTSERIFLSLLLMQGLDNDKNNCR